MRRVKRKPKSNVYFLWLIGGIVLVLGIGIAVSQPKPDLPASAEMPMIPSPVPTPITDSFSQISSDGTMNAQVHTEHVGGDQLRYRLSVNTAEELESREIFTEIVPSTTEVRLPFNSWSPDNKLFFIEKLEPTTNVASQVMVFKANGEAFGEVPYLEIRQEFINKEVPYQFLQATGWASPTLIIVRTLEEDGVTRGPSYWFEVPSQRFIQLYTQF